MLTELPSYHTNFDLESVVTPIKVNVLGRLLRESGYPEQDTEFLVKGFKDGFDLHYEGPMDRRDTAENIPITVGSQIEMWNKVMKEVAAGRYAGPYLQIPFNTFMQSPIGLVPKAGGQTRLIFHLSYQFANGKGSLNSNTPDEFCKVTYKDLDHAVAMSLKMIKKFQHVVMGHKPTIFYGKSDLKSAFRILPLDWKYFRWLILKCREPLTGTEFFFAEKNLPFGGSISCWLFMKFSEALHHLIEYRCNQKYVVTNYLDDFLFLSISEVGCNWLVTNFLDMCQEIGCPVSFDKTEWASVHIVFLGILMDGINHCLCVPEDKRQKAVNQLEWTISRKTATVRQIQCLAGFLNFLNKAILPGRAFTRRMYAQYSHQDKLGHALKWYHHVRVTGEFKDDCKMWLTFLSQHRLLSLCRPFVDVNQSLEAGQDLGFYSDALGKIGYGCSFAHRWIAGKWDEKFMQKNKPSIAYLELFALCVGLKAWGSHLRNGKFVIYCENKSVRDMVNNISTGDRNSMKLIRMLVLDNLTYNRRIKVVYVETKKNSLADALSRGRIAYFKALALKHFKRVNPYPDSVPDCLWPMEKVWEQ